MSFTRPSGRPFGWDQGWRRVRCCRVRVALVSVRVHCSAFSWGRRCGALQHLCEWRFYVPRLFFVYPHLLLAGTLGRVCLLPMSPAHFVGGLRRWVIFPAALWVLVPYQWGLVPLSSRGCWLGFFLVESNIFARRFVGHFSFGGISLAMFVTPVCVARVFGK